MLVAAIVLSLPSLGAALGAQAPSAVRLSPVVVSGQQGARPAIRTTAEPPQAGPILRVLQRRKIGATFRNVRRIIDEMKADGSIDEYLSVDENGQQVVDVSSMAVEIAGRLHTENPGSWWDDIDWDALFAFIEKIITLIMTLFMMVGVNLRAILNRLLAVLQWFTLRKD
jgi:hypothetical protein